MSLLTDQEIHDADPAPHERFDQERIDFARGIEQAVIAKLATVSVEPLAWRLVSNICGEARGVFETQAVELRSERLEPLFGVEALAAARVQALEDFKADLADALCADCENGVKYLNEQASEKFRNDYPTVSALIGGKDV